MAFINVAKYSFLVESKIFDKNIPHFFLDLVLSFPISRLDFVDDDASSLLVLLEVVSLFSRVVILCFFATIRKLSSNLTYCSSCLILASSRDFFFSFDSVESCLFGVFDADGVVA